MDNKEMRSGCLGVDWLCSKVGGYRKSQTGPAVWSEERGRRGALPFRFLFCVKCTVMLKKSRSSRHVSNKAAFKTSLSK